MKNNGAQDPTTGECVAQGVDTFLIPLRGSGADEDVHPDAPSEPCVVVTVVTIPVASCDRTVTEGAEWAYVRLCLACVALIASALMESHT